MTIPSMDRWIDTPLAILPRRAQLMLAEIRSRILNPQAAIVIREPGSFTTKPYDLIGGVAVVPIRGVLVHGDAGWGDETDYNSIAESLTAAVGDSEVKAVCLHVNSPGGEVAGCFDLAEAIYRMRSIKPIVAIVDENMYSAAYALGSSASKIVVPRTGGSGSIGVVMLHLDVTKALENFGVIITAIQFGERKTDFYPTKPLSDEAKSLMQVDINSMGEMFVDLVARNRGLTTKKVRATEAGVFLGKDGVEEGLADAVMSPQAAFLSLVDELN
jgi:capsid assembly protease